MGTIYELTDVPSLDEGMSCVYEIYHVETKKSYYGVSKDPKRRIKDHIKGRSDLKRSHIHNAIKSDGIDSFRFRIIEIFEDKEDAYLLEEELIEKYDSTNTGYNISIGGKGHRKLSDSAMTKLKRLIWITDGISDTRIDCNDEIPEGWRKGRRKFDIRGRKSVFKDGISIRVLSSELDSYLADGWNAGNGQKRARTWKIRNGEDRKVVSQEEFETIYEPVGWVRGWGIQHTKDRSIMVSPEGKRMYVDNSEIDYYENLGWYSVRKRKESEITKRKIYAIETPLGVLVGNITELSKQLGIDRSTLRYRLKRGIHKEVPTP